MNKLWDAIAWLVVTTIHTADRIACWCLEPACPWCGQRTAQLEAHMHVSHAGDDDLWRKP